MEDKQTVGNINVIELPPPIGKTALVFEGCEELPTARNMRKYVFKVYPNQLALPVNGYLFSLITNDLKLLFIRGYKSKKELLTMTGTSPFTPNSGRVIEIPATKLISAHAFKAMLDNLNNTVWPNFYVNSLTHLYQ